MKLGRYWRGRGGHVGGPALLEVTRGSDVKRVALHISQKYDLPRNNQVIFDMIST